MRFLLYYQCGVHFLWIILAEKHQDRQSVFAHKYYLHSVSAGNVDNYYFLLQTLCGRGLSRFYHLSKFNFVNTENILPVDPVLHLSNTIYEDFTHKQKLGWASRNEEKAKLPHNNSSKCSVLQLRGDGSRKKVFKLELVKCSYSLVLFNIIGGCIVIYSISEVFHVEKTRKEWWWKGDFCRKKMALDISRFKYFEKFSIIYSGFCLVNSCANLDC